MSYSFTEKKRIRKDFGKTHAVLPTPNLLKIQLDSYKEFLQLEADPKARPNKGLQYGTGIIFSSIDYDTRKVKKMKI